jgi:small subunit ribosomal protein S4
MGDIKKIRKKYSKPSHPWRQSRIDEENAIIKEYGISKKTELWKTISKLESFKNQAKSVAAVNTGQSSNQNLIQRQNLFNRMASYNLVKVGDSLDAVLGVTLQDVLNRRLQTLVFKKGFAKSMKQSRQMITHRHILIKSKIVTSPSYLVRSSEEASIEVSPKSPFYDTNHAERVKESTKRVRKAPEKRPMGRRPRR